MSDHATEHTAKRTPYCTSVTPALDAAECATFDTALVSTKYASFWPAVNSTFEPAFDVAKCSTLK